MKIPASRKLAGLMDEFSPSAVVTQKELVDSKKRAGMRNALLKEAEKRRIPIQPVSRRTVRVAFPGSNRNKYTIAAALAKQLPELGPRLPGLRKIWKSEDYRISIFDAAALGVAYFSRAKRRAFSAGREIRARHLVVPIQTDRS